MAKYILVGEVHGTNECPEACLKILEKYKIKHLALEGDKSMSSNDGRASKAVKRLVAAAKRKGIKIHFAEEKSDAEMNILKRDKTMAENLIKIKKDVVFLCGNVHACKKPFQMPLLFRIFCRIKKITIPKNNILDTCGSYLPKNKTISYRVVAKNGGKFNNNGIKTEGPSKKLPLGIIKSPEESYDFYYVVDRFTPSD
ncbi:MAG: hypothetical protein V1734_00300 [Nanoarchaeota archaeon]